MYKHDDIHKTGNEKLVATPPEEDQATQTGNMHGKYDEVFSRYVCKQFARPTDMQTLKLI